MGGNYSAPVSKPSGGANCGSNGSRVSSSISGGGGSSKSGIMKAPGGGGSSISRAIFESSPRAYFTGLRTGKKSCK